MEDNSTRYFTVEEANAALEVLRPLVEQALKIRQEILARQPEAWPAIEKSAGNGGNLAASQIEAWYQRINEVIRRIRATGVLVKDINTGLLDFPSLREGREVYLCWRFGEAQVMYWHDVDAGFAGRQKL